MRELLQFAAKCHRPFWRLVFSILLTASMPSPAHAATSAQQLLAAGQVDEVIRDLDQQISRAPNDAEAYNLLCRADFMIEDWDRGISACERATKLDPQNSLYYLWLGRI